MCCVSLCVCDICVLGYMCVFCVYTLDVCVCVCVCVCVFMCTVVDVWVVSELL